MKAGTNRIQGRNSNYMDFNPDGSAIVASGISSISINGGSPIPENITTEPNLTTGEYIIPNPIFQTASFSIVADIVPTSSIQQTSSQVVVEEVIDLSTQFLPDVEETFTSLFDDNIDVTSLQVFDSLNEIKSWRDESYVSAPTTNINSLKVGNAFKNLREPVKKLDSAFYDKVVDVAKKLGNEKLVDALLATMKHESQFSTSISAPGNVTRGLIQFFFGKAKTIKIGNKGPFTREQLASQTRVQQMDLVYEFYRYWFKALGISKPNLVDIYVVTFFPAAVGKPDNYVLKTSKISAETVADQNPAFNRVLKRPRKEPLTIAKLKQYYQIQGFPL